MSNDTLRSAFLAALDAAQRRVIDTQEKVSSGQRVNKPSDDPVAAARIAHLDASLSRLDQYQQNSVFARNQLGLEESSLTSVIDNLQRVRELALQGNNSTASDADRKVIADEIGQIRDALLALANTTDVDGRHLFGGYDEAATPFVKTATGTVVYNGDQGQRTLQISDSRFVAINDSGAAVFQQVAQGNGTFVIGADGANTGTGTLGAGSVTDPTAWVRDTYTVTFLTPTSYEVRDSANALVSSGTFADGQSIAFRGVEFRIDGTPAAGDKFTAAPAANRDIFGMLDDLIGALRTPSADAAGRAQMHSNVGQRIADVDSALSHVIDARGEIGARVRALDQQDSLNADFSLHLNTTLSSVRDLDYADALSKLSQQLLGLDAAQKSFAETQNLSLFRYL
ncbi:MAG TPA: flagellar hook-associated protein FlgL [Gammaproteobacteria bacterium]|nr:flagellar hook-associated protein FlgL [Gammaproteobacteria bacterium]